MFAAAIEIVDVGVVYPMDTDATQLFDPSSDSKRRNSHPSPHFDPSLPRGCCPQQHFSMNGSRLSGVHVRPAFGFLLLAAVIASILQASAIEHSTKTTGKYSFSPPPVLSLTYSSFLQSTALKLILQFIKLQFKNK